MELIVKIENFSTELETLKKESLQSLGLKNTRTEIKDSVDGLKISRKGENLLLHFSSHKMHVTPPTPQKSFKLQSHCNTEECLNTKS